MEQDYVKKIPLRRTSTGRCVCQCKSLAPKRKSYLSKRAGKVGQIWSGIVGRAPARLVDQVHFL
jgi:hypothetical protein